LVGGGKLTAVGGWRRNPAVGGGRARGWRPFAVAPVVAAADAQDNAAEAAGAFRSSRRRTQAWPQVEAAEKRQEYDSMQAPVVGGVRLPHGNGEDDPVGPAGASLSDFAEKIDANPGLGWCRRCFNLGEMVTATQSVGGRDARAASAAR